MSIKCPKCSALIDAEPDELGLVTCGQCGARLRSKQPVKVTVQGGAGAGGGTGSSGSFPSLPKIDPARAAPADVDHVLARLDTPSPDATIRPGGVPRSPAAAPAPLGLEALLAELLEIKKTQAEILALLKGSAALSRPEARGLEDEPAAAPAKPQGSGGRVVLLVDDDAATRQEAAAALRPLATVKTAGDGSSALATIALEKPAAVVLELAMGGPMPARDVVNMIKATMEWVDIPIVLYTRMNVGEDADARQVHGADEIVTKGPGSARVLAAKLGRLLGRG